MVATQSAAEMSPKLLRVMERAKRDPETRFSTLAHLLDVDALERSYGRIRKNAAGSGWVTKEEYGRGLRRKLEDLHGRLRSKSYRHGPIRRVHIPKEQGKTRPIGISSMEDKVVQGALTEVLQAVYEPIFRDCSYGFRPRRSAHDALRALNQVLDRGEGNWVLAPPLRRKRAPAPLVHRGESKQYISAPAE